MKKLVDGCGLRSSASFGTLLLVRFVTTKSVMLFCGIVDLDGLSTIASQIGRSVPSTALSFVP